LTVGGIIYLQGGRSEVQIKQAVGRGTRRVPGKEDFFFFDFDVYNVGTTHRHAEARVKVYEDIYEGSYKEMYV
jgi:superfamily II DNA or RNA helicase